MTIFRFARRVRAGAGLAAVLLLPLAACDSDEILDVTDPDIINPGDINTAEGANALRLGAMSRFNFATSGGSSGNEGFWLLGGMMADEWRSGDTFVQRNDWDRRSVPETDNLLSTAYRWAHRARLSAQQAVDALTEWEAPAWQVAQMYFVQAYTENMLAEHLCSGIVFSTVVDGEPVFGDKQFTTAEALERALAHADSGLALVQGATANDTQWRNALSVIKGRILLNLNRYADAAAAVANVPSDFVLYNEHSETTNDNSMWSLNNAAGRYIVGNGDGGNGIDFVGANDPRVPVCEGGSAVCNAAGVLSDEPFDPAALDAGVPLYVQLIWPDRGSPAAVVTGIEARLIEAESMLSTDPAAALQIHNDLRATVPGLAPLADPGSADARVDLHFRERAFWLFGTGTRLGDLRRLVRQYGRDAESVFPTGIWFKAGTAYGTDVNFPLPQNEQNNPNLPTNASCLDRNA